MKVNMVKKSFLAVIALLSSMFMVSCVADSDEIISASGDGTLTIAIKSGDFDVALTRAVTSDPTATENMITAAQTVIAIFDADGKLISAQVPELIDGKLTLSKTQTGTDWLASANTVYVVGNVPASMVTTLTGLTAGTDTQATFATAFSLVMTDALNSSSLAGSVVPMFGKADISNTGGGNYSASVNVEHMLTKVSLNSLGVDFSQSTTPNASFQPEQVFLINVPDNIGISDAGVITQTSPSKWYYGEVAGATADGANNNTGANHSVPAYSTTYTTGYGDQFNADSNLGTAALTDQTAMSAENPVWLSSATAGSQVAQKYYFYTMPNTTASNDKTKTRLVIRGAWKDNSSATAQEVYYAVPLANTTSGLPTESLDANKNYKIDVIIKQKGSTDAYAALPNDITSVLAITSTITNFSDQNVVVGIGSGAYTPGTTATAKVGDYFYSDGTWSSVYDTKGNTRSLVGLVFSTNVSSTDIAAGYTHGYVMALTDAGYNYNSGSPTKVKYKYRDYDDVPTSGPKAAGLFNIGTTATQYSDNTGYWAAVKADLAGREHTTAILADANQAEYLAAHAAAEYGVTVPGPAAESNKTSGWYLPSIGQLYALAYNFGGRTAWSGLTFNNGSKANEGAYNEYHNCYFTAGADVTTTAINDFLTARLVTAAGLTAGQHYQPFIDRHTESETASNQWCAYWSSSDYSAFNGLYLHFTSNGNLLFNCLSKAYAYYVRPVLAF